MFSWDTGQRSHAHKQHNINVVKQRNNARSRGAHTNVC
jgi:hypothetical protein